MALIAMAVHDTEENGRKALTESTLQNLLYGDRVDYRKHRLIVINNGSCEASKKMMDSYLTERQIIHLPENIGTAAAINLAWKRRQPGEHAVKIDNDVNIVSGDWMDELEYAIARDKTIGQIGLKRKDCWEHPLHENPELRSTLKMLPHEPYQKWVIVEKAKHIMGTCVMHSSALLDKIGYLWQPGLYGYDDVLMSWRANLAGFITCFLPHIEIFHIDPGGDEYSDWKTRHSGQYQKLVSDIVDEYIAGTRPLYYNPFES